MYQSRFVSARFAPLRFVPAHFAPLRRALFPLAGLLPMLLLLLLTHSAAAAPITYTGQLLNPSGPPVGDSHYDFQFSLYTAPTGGTQVGSTLSVASIPVVSGVFYVELDFGSVVNGQTLYLQTAYRKHPASGNPPYTTQSPRKLLPTSPYADYAAVSGSTNALQGTAVSATAPTYRQVLTFDGTLWSPQAAAAYTAGSGLALNGTQFSVAVPLSLTGSSLNGILVVHNTATASGAYDGIQSYTSGSNASAVVGIHYGAGNGVYGQTSTGDAILGSSRGQGGNAVYGTSSGGKGGVFITSYEFGLGVQAEATGPNATGLFALNDTSGAGAVCSSDTGTGVEGYSRTYVGVYGEAGEASAKAGYFLGDVTVTGNLSKSGGSFKIDHPLDPEHKYLYHSFVESPDMMNIYNGNVTTDAQGSAAVTMPDWFQALNQDFRYQLTVIGQFAQAVVATEMKGNTFTIKTDKPGVKVSWQVTGIRHDAWANAHRIPVEEDKPDNEQGLYLHPKEFGQPEELGIGYARRQARAAHGPKP